MMRPLDRRRRLVALMREGLDDRRILDRLIAEKGRPATAAELANLGQQLRAARDEFDYEAEGGPIRRKGPWPVSYVRPSGEKVYRVGAGHDVPEGSLKALGFEP